MLNAFGVIMSLFSYFKYKKYVKKHPNRFDEVLNELRRLEHTNRKFWENFNPELDNNEIHSIILSLDNTFIPKAFNAKVNIEDYSHLDDTVMLRVSRLMKENFASINIRIYKQDLKRVKKILSGSWGYDFTELMCLLNKADKKL